MIPLLACVLSAQTASITLKTGYYNLREIASSVSQQGVRVRALSDCAGDVYAIRTERLAWPALRDALQEDGRLVVVESKGDIRIERSAKNKTAESADANKYERALAGPIHAIYEEAAGDCRKLQSLPAETRKNLASTGQIAEAGANPVVKDLVNGWANETIPFATIALTAALASPDQPFLWQHWSSTLADSPGIVVPGGGLRQLNVPGVDLNKMGDADFATFTRSGRIVGHLSIDPISFASMSMTIGYATTPGVPYMSIGIERISPGHLLPFRERSELFRETTVAEMARRNQTSKKLLSDADLSTPFQLGDKPMPASAALLKWAEASNTNLVCYVADFADFQLPPPGKAGLSQIVEKVNGNKVDPSWIGLVAKERVSSESYGPGSPVVLPSPILTLSRDAGVVVVRNELRFLDTLCSSPPGMPTSMANMDFYGQMPGLDVVTKHLVTLPVSTWSSSLFSSNYLRFCNPVAFRPFADLLQNSPSVREKLRHISPGAAVSIPFGEVEPAAREAFNEAVVGCATLSDGDCAWGDPPMIRMLFRDNAGRNPKIEIRNDNGRYVFRFVQYGESPWSAWIDHVDVR